MSSEIEFKDNMSVSDKYPTSGAGRKYSKITYFVINHSGGYIKDERQASYLFLVIAVVAFFVAALNINSAFKNSAPKPLPYESPAREDGLPNIN